MPSQEATDSLPAQEQGASPAASVPPPVPLRIGATVHTLDGPAGTVERVVVSPRSRRVTHLIVRAGWPLPALGRAVVVPVSLVHEWSIDGTAVVVALTRRELEALPGFVETAFVSPDPTWEPPAGYERSQVLHRLVRGEEVEEAELLESGLLVHRRKLGLTDELVTLQRGQRVLCLEGEAGRVEGVLVNLATGVVTHFVLRRGGVGPFFGQRLIVPVDWVRSIDDDVVLDVGLEQLARLPEFRGRPQDRALAAAVQHALAHDPRTSAHARAIGVVAHAGVVELTGAVASEAIRAAALAVAAEVPGVLEVRNALTADTELRAAVQAALAADPQTAQEAIDVLVTGGTVTLTGTVRNPTTRSAAETLARSVPGVALVINELTVAT
jgi:osmotically-inducible protein OsmY/sporulation protein YlmC with PRC-barrel domain